MLLRKALRALCSGLGGWPRKSNVGSFQITSVAMEDFSLSGPAD